MANDNLLSIVEAEMQEGTFAQDDEFDDSFHYYVDAYIFENQGATYQSKDAAITDMKEAIKGLDEYISSSKGLKKESLQSLKESCESCLKELENGNYDYEWKDGNSED